MAKAGGSGQGKVQGARTRGGRFPRELCGNIDGRGYRGHRHPGRRNLNSRFSKRKEIGAIPGYSPVKPSPNLPQHLKRKKRVRTRKGKSPVRRLVWANSKKILREEEIKGMGRTVRRNGTMSAVGVEIHVGMDSRLKP